MRRTTTSHLLRATIAVSLLAVGGCSGAGSAATVASPAWDRATLGTSAPDVVVAMDLETLRDDPLFGRVLERLARHDLGMLLRASQLDAVAMFERGEPRSWIAVAHGIDGPPRPGDIGPDVEGPHALPGGASEYDGPGGGGLVTWPGSWIFGDGAAFARVKAERPFAVPSIAMPSRALVVSTWSGRAIPNARRLAEGLDDATFEVLGGSRLDFVLRCRYVDGDAARAAVTEARLVLVAMAERDDVVAALARALVKVDFDVHGNVAMARVTLTDDLRALLERYAARED